MIFEVCWFMVIFLWFRCRGTSKASLVAREAFAKGEPQQQQGETKKG
jgi:hypothetical protein